MYEKVLLAALVASIIMAMRPLVRLCRDAILSRHLRAFAARKFKPEDGGFTNEQLFSGLYHYAEHLKHRLRFLADHFERHGRRLPLENAEQAITQALESAMEGVSIRETRSGKTLRQLAQDLFSDSGNPSFPKHLREDGVRWQTDMESWIDVCDRFASELTNKILQE